MHAEFYNQDTVGSVTPYIDTKTPIQTPINSVNDVVSFIINWLGLTSSVP